MHFTRTLQKHVTKTGTSYVLSIPREIAQSLGLQDGGLCSIELVYKFYRHKKGVNAHAVLMAYKDTQPLVTERFDPLRFHNPGTHLFVDVPIKPRTKGKSRPWGQGRAYDRSVIHELRAASLFLEAEMKRIWPYRRSRKKR